MQLGYSVLRADPLRVGRSGYISTTVLPASCFTRPSECTWLVPGTHPDDPQTAAAEATYVHDRIMSHFERLPI